jgi:hypothetical protein
MGQHRCDNLGDGPGHNMVKLVGFMSKRPIDLRTSINGTTFGIDLLPFRIRDHRTLILHEIWVQGQY